METDNTGTVQAIYTYGNDLVSINRAGVNSYYHYDGLGSTRQLTDSTGSVTVSYTYDSFGNLIDSTGTSDNTYGFTGEQQFEEADDLVFLRARYYDPRVGRFISRDPIGYVDSMNLYAYVGNNVVNKRDPLGLYWMPAPGTRPWAPDPGSSCCKKHGPSIAEMLGMSVLECAWLVMGETWGPKKLPFGVGGGLVGIKKVPSIGVGLGIGTSLQYIVALAFCDYRECEEYGTIDSCGRCR